MALGSRGRPPAGRGAPRSRYLLLPLAAAALAAGGVLTAVALAQPTATRAACRATGRTLALCRTRLGRVLVDSRGHTLYLFENDRRGRSTCYGRCARFWPPLLERRRPTLGPGVERSLVGATRRRNGALQLTYRRHPLYAYRLDRRPGQANGEGVQAFGARWYAISRAGVAVRPRAVPTTTTPTTTPTTTTGTTCSTPPCY
ncbi:MAG TPA: hypothetical protein VE995_03765 [Gaiellaceae bacterium]|nr:hypothetical protein [Gaiellaceae bacterium]